MNIPAEARVADAESPIELIGTSLVHRILAKYAASLSTAGSQLGQIGVGYASTPALGAVGTVAMKLARSPIVERVLWLESAADVAQRVGTKRMLHTKDPDLTCERADVVDVLFEFNFNANKMYEQARRLERMRCYREQWCLLVVELSAAIEDEAFRDWAMS